GRLHTMTFRHPLEALGPAYATAFNLGPVPRPGDAHTPNAASHDPKFAQTSGASYRHVLDRADWDRGLATTTPPQSAHPASQHSRPMRPAGQAALRRLTAFVASRRVFTVGIFALERRGGHGAPNASDATGLAAPAHLRHLRFTATVTSAHRGSASCASLHWSSERACSFATSTTHSTRDVPKS